MCVAYQVQRLLSLVIQLSNELERPSLCLHSNVSPLLPQQHKERQCELLLRHALQMSKKVTFYEDILSPLQVLCARISSTAAIVSGCTLQARTPTRRAWHVQQWHFHHCVSGRL